MSFSLFGIRLDIRAVGAFALLLANLGCSGPDQNPELKDPIARDLAQSLGALRAQLSAEEKHLKELEIQLAKSPAQSKERKIVLRDRSKAEMRAKFLAQQVAYTELKLKKRTLISRQRYFRAYSSNSSDWIDRREYEAYQTSKRLSGVGQSLGQPQ